MFHSSRYTVPPIIFFWTWKVEKSKVEDEKIAKRPKGIVSCPNYDLLQVKTELDDRSIVPLHFERWKVKAHTGRISAEIVFSRLGLTPTCFLVATRRNGLIKAYFK